MPRWAVPALVAMALALMILGYALELDWLVALVFVTGVGALVVYALTLLAAGQREWFGREHRRHDDR